MIKIHRSEEKSTHQPSYQPQQPYRPFFPPPIPAVEQKTGPRPVGSRSREEMVKFEAAVAAPQIQNPLERDLFTKSAQAMLTALNESSILYNIIVTDKLNPGQFSNGKNGTFDEKKLDKQTLRTSETGGETGFDFDTNSVFIRVSADQELTGGILGDELQTAYQFQTGKIGFSEKGIIGYEVLDEIETKVASVATLRALGIAAEPKHKLQYDSFAIMKRIAALMDETPGIRPATIIEQLTTEELWTFARVKGYEGLFPSFGEFPADPAAQASLREKLLARTDAQQAAEKLNTSPNTAESGLQTRYMRDNKLVRWPVPEITPPAKKP